MPVPIRPFVLTLFVVLHAVPATAQIYAWRDANGTLVLSDRKMDPSSAETYEVPGSTSVRATRPPAPGAAGGRFEPLIAHYSAAQGLRPDLVRAVIAVESAFNPRARSPKGAMGLMQLMPATAAELGVADPYDPADNIRGGTAYLRQLLDRYEGNEELALAAYNAGAGAVDRYGRRVPPYRETLDYVKKIGSASGVQRPAASQRVIYRTYDVVEGRRVPRYSTTRPASGPYEVILR